MRIVHLFEKGNFTNHVPDILSCIESGVFVIYRLEAQDTSVYPKSPYHAHNTLFPTF